VVCNWETAEPLWFGKERKKETLDDFFRSQLVSRQQKRIEAARVDMWKPFRLSLEPWAPQCKIVYDKFHILQHADDAIDEVRRAEFFRPGKQKHGLIHGKEWLRRSRWKNLPHGQRGELNRLFQLNRRVFQAREFRGVVEVPLRRGYGQLSQAVVGSTEVAAADIVRGTRRHAAEASGGHSELLPDQGSLWGGRGWSTGIFAC
jgi:hypothetical protein